MISVTVLRDWNPSRYPRQKLRRELYFVGSKRTESQVSRTGVCGPKAATFATAKALSSWVGACPGEEESAGVNRSKRSPKGNRQMRRILNQAANAAVKHKGSIFEILYRRLVLRLGHNKTIGAIAHRLCHLIWIILHHGVRYEERGPAVCEKSKRLRTVRMIRTLRNLGYRVEPLANPASGI
ncbi:MAG: transposase [Acidobacteriia bacterium]|nr:transposase [Terriglobia bacterium]